MRGVDNNAGIRGRVAAGLLQRLKMGAQVALPFTMAIKVLLDEDGELRLRISGESHTALQLFRSRLNENKDVEYSNYFLGHPSLDEPELYLRVKKGKDASKVLKTLCSGIAKEFGKVKLS